MLQAPGKELEQEKSAVAGIESDPYTAVPPRPAGILRAPGVEVSEHCENHMDMAWQLPQWT